MNTQPNHKLLLSTCLDHVDALTGYLKVLYRSTAYLEQDYRDHNHRLVSTTTVEQGGDSALVSVALETLSDLHRDLQQVHQLLTTEEDGDE